MKKDESEEEKAIIVLPQNWALIWMPRGLM